MVAPKTLQTAATALFGLLVLPFVVVIAMIVGLLVGMGSAQACEPAAASPKAFSWPTETQQIKRGFSEAQGRVPAHQGVDFEVPRGKKVFAARDGKVYDTTGDWVKIRLDEKTEIWYQFFDSKSVREGQDVKRGDVIGTTGGGTETSGMSGDHLHFEWRVRRDDGDTLTAIDPSSQFGDPNQPAGGGCGCSVGPDNLTGANNTQKAFNYLVQVGYTKEQAAGVVGNMLTESQVDPTAQFSGRTGITPAQALEHRTAPWPQSGRGNAYGVVQWFPASKLIDESREAGKSDEEIGSLAFQLDFLRRQLIGQTRAPEKGAGDHLKQQTTIEGATRSFAVKYERFALEPLSPAEEENVTERTGDAREVLRQYGAGAPQQGSGSQNPAGGGCGGAGNGNIVATAKALAWPKEMPPNNHQSFGNYEQAVRQYNPGAGTHTDVFTDCGVYVATVMRMSGADPDYPPRGTSNMLPYLQSSPKYASQTSGVPPPGAIMITDGHIYLYLGPYKGSDQRDYNAATASLFDHTPEASWYDADYVDSSNRRYVAYYLKNPPAGTPPQA